MPGLGLGVGRRALPILSFRRGRSLGASGVSGGVQALAPAVRAFLRVVIEANRVGTGGFLKNVGDGAASAATAADVSASVAAGTAPAFTFPGVPGFESSLLCSVAAFDFVIDVQADFAVFALVESRVAFATEILDRPVLNAEAGWVRIAVPAVKREDVRE